MSDAYRAQLARRNAVEALQDAGEPLPNPREKAWEVARRWLSSSSTDAFFADLDDAGLTICWKAPTDG